ncbi:MAG: hypothetical protein KDA24_13555 [Deltaproteobacteria bacterium]|nr:hypothetical protein [Deltaproteobacteria bacterium]
MTRNHSTRTPLILTVAAALAGCAPPMDGAATVLVPSTEPRVVGYAPDGAPVFAAAGLPDVMGQNPENPENPETPDPTDPEPAEDPETQTPPMWDGDFLASAEAAIDDFCAAGFTGVRGDVVVSGSVTDLSAFDCLQSVRADLRVEFAPALIRVDAFPNLTEVGGSISIANLSGLEVLVGFDSLEVLEGSLQITECRSLRDIEIAPVLPGVGGDVSLRWTDAVESIAMLGETTRIGGDYVLERFGVVSAVPLLSGLGQVDGSVEVLDNPQLGGVDALMGLELIGGDFVIDANPGLGSAAAEEAGAEMADRVGGQIVIGRNGE